MTRSEYETTEDYRRSLRIVCDFVNDVLDGDIEKLKNFCFRDSTKYVGNIVDPDMYLITQAIYIILWGYVYDLTFKKMGSWNWNNEYAFRGDTMNSFGSLLGKEDKRNGKCFAFRAKYYDADKKAKLWEKIEDFYRMYHMVGNFIVIPNRGSLQNGINGARAQFYNNKYCEGMRDYFDHFLIAIAEYQKKVEGGEAYLGKFERQLQMNPEYNPAFLKIADWEDIFFLKHYFRDGAPVLLFKTPLEERLKKTAPSSDREELNFYQTDEYLELLDDYLDKSKAVIAYRTDKIVEGVKEKLSHIAA